MRRPPLSDDVVDIVDIVDVALQVLEGVLIRPEGELETAVAGLGDAMSENDLPFRSTFPFIAAPHSGSDVDAPEME